MASHESFDDDKLFQDNENPGEELSNADDSFLYQKMNDMSLDMTTNEVQLKKKKKETVKRGPLVWYLMYSSAIPTIIGVILVSLISNGVNYYNRNISVRMIKNSNANQVQAGFKSICQLLSNSMMEILSPDLDATMHMRDSLTSLEDNLIIDPTSGNYYPLFKSRVDQKKIKLKCYTLLELLGRDDKYRFQGCLLLNDAYSVLKSEEAKEKEGKTVILGKEIRS